MGTPVRSSSRRMHVPHRRQRPPPRQQQRRYQQPQPRSGGDPADGACGAQRRVRAPVQQQKARAQPDDQLSGGLRHLPGGGGHHVPQPLAVAPQRRRQAHQQHRRAQRPQGRRRVRVVQRRRQRPRHKAHHGGADQSHPRQQRHPYAQALPHRAEAPLRRRPGHHPAQRHRQPGGGQHQQQAVDVVRRVKMRHALAVQQIPQGDLVQRAQQLRHRHGPGQNDRAAHEILPPLGHGASLPLNGPSPRHLLMEPAKRL